MYNTILKTLQNRLSQILSTDFEVSEIQNLLKQVQREIKNVPIQKVRNQKEVDDLAKKWIKANEKFVADFRKEQAKELKIIGLKMKYFAKISKEV